MKKYMISFFTLLFLVIVVVSIFIILVIRDKKAQQDAVEVASKQQLTIIPTEAISPAVSPTVMPGLAAAPIITELYPAFQTIDKETKYGYIDKSGVFVIEPVFDSAADYHDGVAVVTLDGQDMVIDASGNAIYVSNHTISDFSNGAAVFSDQGDDKVKYGYIDTNGKVIIDAEYDMAADFLADNTAYVNTGGNEYALIDKTGKVLETYTLENKDLSRNDFSDKFIIINGSDNKYGVISIKGEEIIKPIYSSIRKLGNGYFAVKEPGLEYYEAMASEEAIFNQKGEQLTDYSFYDIGNYNDGYFSASDDTSTFFIDPDGERIAELPEFDGIGTLKLSGNVIEAYIDGQLFYCTTNKLIFWQDDQTIALSDDISVNTMKFRPNRFALVQYPQLDGLADETLQDSINLSLKKIFIDSRRKSVKEDWTEINDSFSASLLGNLLIIEKGGYDYPFGAAHGMPIMDYYYVDIRTGVYYQFKDLFIEGSDYATKVNDMITNQITAALASDGSMFFPGEFKGIAESPYFILDKDAVSIYFYPYDIAAYAGGFPTFLIPFADIDQYINKDGAFWNSFH